MLFQLPNGKTINLTVDEYLNLTDEDIQAFTALNFGEYATSYWYGSCLDTHEKPKTSNDEFYMLSLEEQDEYSNQRSSFDLDSIPDEDADYTEFIDLD